MITYEELKNAGEHTEEAIQEVLAFQHFMVTGEELEVTERKQYIQEQLNEMEGLSSPDDLKILAHYTQQLKELQDSQIEGGN